MEREEQMIQEVKDIGLLPLYYHDDRKYVYLLPTHYLMPA